MRFDNALAKIEDFLSFPKTLAVQGQYEYELYALVLHNGRLISHGHFVAFVRDQQENWYRADDLCMYRMKEDAVFTSCPYVLFYKRTNV
jgi:ubiquitin C-terminal hydrolase